MSPDQLAPPGVRQLPLLAGLVLLWLLLWGTWSWANVLSGLIVAVLVMVLLPLPPVTEHARFRPVAVARLVGGFLRDIVVSSLEVAWVALRLRRPVRSAIIGVQLRSDSDLLLTLVNQMLNLVPGTLVLDVDRSSRRLLVHVLLVRDDADIERHRHDVLAVEERIVRAFGSARELAGLGVPIDPQPRRSGTS